MSSGRWAAEPNAGGPRGQLRRAAPPHPAGRSQRRGAHGDDPPRPRAPRRPGSVQAQLPAPPAPRGRQLLLAHPHSGAPGTPTDPRSRRPRRTDQLVDAVVVALRHLAQPSQHGHARRHRPLVASAAPSGRYDWPAQTRREPIPEPPPRPRCSRLADGIRTEAADQSAWGVRASSLPSVAMRLRQQRALRARGRVLSGLGRLLGGQKAQRRAGLVLEQRRGSPEPSTLETRCYLKKSAPRSLKLGLLVSKYAWGRVCSRSTAQLAVTASRSHPSYITVSQTWHCAKRRAKKTLSLWAQKLQCFGIPSPQPTEQHRTQPCHRDALCGTWGAQPHLYRSICCLTGLSSGSFKIVCKARIHFQTFHIYLTRY